MKFNGQRLAYDGKKWKRTTKLRQQSVFNQVQEHHRTAVRNVHGYLVGNNSNGIALKLLLNAFFKAGNTPEQLSDFRKYIISTIKLKIIRSIISRLQSL